MRRIIHLNNVVAITALTVTAMLSLAAPAQAAERDGRCDSGEFCYYFNSGNAGSVSDFASSVRNYGTNQPTCYEFRGRGNGRGVCIRNNAASVRNRTNKTVRVYYNTGYAGASQDIAPGGRGNLNSALGNENASHKFLSGSTATARTASWFDKTYTCSGSNWIEKVRVRGFGQRRDYMVTPTRRGRTFYNDASGSPQITACVGAQPLSPPQLESIRKQMVCHAADRLGFVTGPDWGGESWRTNRFAWNSLPSDCNWESAATPLRLLTSNFRNTYVYAYRNLQAKIGWVPSDWTSRYVAVPGLAGEGVSFESRYYPGTICGTRTGNHSAVTNVTAVAVCGVSA
jgi:hypothetical protein